MAHRVVRHANSRRCVLCPPHGADTAAQWPIFHREPTRRPQTSSAHISGDYCPRTVDRRLGRQGLRSARFEVITCPVLARSTPPARSRGSNKTPERLRATRFAPRGPRARVPENARTDPTSPPRGLPRSLSVAPLAPRAPRVPHTPSGSTRARGRPAGLAQTHTCPLSFASPRDARCSASDLAEPFARTARRRRTPTPTSRRAGGRACTPARARRARAREAGSLGARLRRL